VNNIKSTLILMLIILMTVSTFIIAQESPTIIRARYITVKDGMSERFIETAGKKTKKYNSKEGSRKFFTWQIIDGPRQGQFVRGQRGTTWSDFDTPIDQKQRDYWQKNVSPNVEKAGNMETWRYYPELSYNGRGENAPASNFARQWFITVKPGMDSKYMDLRRKIKEVHEAKKTDRYFAVYRKLSGGDRNTWLYSSGFYKWEDLNMSNFVSMYEEVHGKGSWDDFTKNLNDALVEGSGAHWAEYWRYLKEASSPLR